MSEKQYDDFGTGNSSMSMPGLQELKGEETNIIVSIAKKLSPEEINVLRAAAAGARGEAGKLLRMIIDESKTTEGLSEEELLNFKARKAPFTEDEKRVIDSLAQKLSDNEIGLILDKVNNLQGAPGEFLGKIIEIAEK